MATAAILKKPLNRYIYIADSLFPHNNGHRLTDFDEDLVQ